ncbi:hypothetical protein [Nocardia aurea]|uniref:hypothetical protein n=1 Tax=Nocardia aurea TaxID=2144174 RepID=UPI0033A30BB2
MADVHDALTAATERAQAQQELRADRPLTPTPGWWTPFSASRQTAGGYETCPVPSIYPCDCGYPRKETTP